MDDAGNPILQDRSVEIEQESNLPPTEPQVRQDLRLVHGKHLFNRLEFDDDSAIDENVKAISAIETQPFVLNRQSTLPLKRNLSQSQLTA